MEGAEAAAAAGEENPVEGGAGSSIVSSTAESAAAAAVARLNGRNPSPLTVIEGDTGGSHSWRCAVMALRSEFPVYASPGAGPVRGSGPGAMTMDTPEEVGMFRRALAMRENLDQVMDSQISKYQRRLNEKMQLAALVEKEEEEAIAHGAGDATAAKGAGGEEEESDDEDFDPPEVSAVRKAQAAEARRRNKAFEDPRDRVRLPKSDSLEPLGSNIYASNLKKMGHSEKDGDRMERGGGHPGGGGKEQDGGGAAGGRGYSPPTIKSRISREDQEVAEDDMYADLDD